MTHPAASAPLSGAPSTPGTAEELAQVIVEQFGVVTWDQCLASGMTRKAIQVRLESGRWTRLHRGVYLTLPGRDDWWTSALAALSASGKGAALSHASAAFAWGIAARPGPMIHVLIPHAQRLVPPSGVALHRSSYAAQRVHDHAWPWRTTVADTVLDVAAAGSADDLFALMGRAFQRNLTDEAELRRALDARSAHRWGALLRTVLDDAGTGAQSAMEVRYLRDVEGAHGLPRGIRQQPTDTERGRRFHDVGYREQAVLVELDGRLGHEEQGARVRDGVRDRKSAVSGWLTTRAFWADVTLGRCALAVDVAAILKSRGWDGAPRRCRRSGCSVPR